MSPITQCFIPALPLSLPIHHLPLSCSPTAPSPFSRTSTRKRRSRITPCAVIPVANPSTSLSSALEEITTFSGSESQAKDLIIRLINNFSATSSVPEALPTLFSAFRKASLLRAFSALRAPSNRPNAKSVSAEKLAAKAGLPLSALSPRKSTVFAWQFAGVAAVVAVVQVANVLGIAEFAKPLLICVGASLAFDQIVMKGLLFEGVYRTLFPAYEEKVVKHEAGHFLAAYLHGLAVRGYVLSASEAFKEGIPGQAGTIFEDGEMYEGLKKGKVTGGVVDRYSVVSMAGIAAEAVYYGEAEGGESDVSGLVSLLTGLQPPWSESSVKSQARWAVLEAVLLIRENEDAYKALCTAMRERKSLGECVLCIEENFVVKEGVGKEDGDGNVDGNVDDGKKSMVDTNEVDFEGLDRREQAILAELERIKRQVEKLES